MFGIIGIDYRRASLDVRDRASFTDAGKIEFFQMVEGVGIQQCMILSTCNRSEILFFFESDEQKNGLRSIYFAAFGDSDIKEYVNELYGADAATHIFRVASGLESMVLGEDQILGQVKDALDFSRTMGFAGKELTRLVRDAVTTAKKIKTELKISEKPLSVAYIGICELQKSCAIEGKRVFVIGSGKTASLALRYVFELGAGTVFACSRTYAHAHELRTEFPLLKIVDFDDRYEVMGECDIVISATASPHLVVRMEGLMQKCSNSPEQLKKIVFLDLAAPRDIDPAIGEAAQLINLDTLNTIAENNRQQREALVEQSRNIICEDAKSFLVWLESSRVDSTIESLQSRCSEIAEDSFSYLCRKIELSHHDKRLLRKVLNASLHRLLKEPIIGLKGLEGTEQEEYKKIVEKLFQIGD